MFLVCVSKNTQKHLRISRFLAYFVPHCLNITFNKQMNKQLLPLLSAGLLSLNLAAERPANILWAIGKADNSAAEFALAPDGYKQFLANDFGYEDK